MGLGRDLVGFLGILDAFRTWDGRRGGGEFFVRMGGKAFLILSFSYFHSVSIGPWMTSFSCSGESGSFVCMMRGRDRMTFSVNRDSCLGFGEWWGVFA